MTKNIFILILLAALLAACTTSETFPDESQILEAVTTTSETKASTEIQATVDLAQIDPTATTEIEELEPADEPIIEGLSLNEAEGLSFMREEEKLARDVYLTLYDLWGLPLFQNIADSEQAHMDAVKSLLDFYGLDDPAAGQGVGIFTNADLQAL